MTEDEARTLSQRFVDTWPNGPKAYIWANEFKPLHHASACEAFVKLRKSTDRATTAQFHAAYIAIRGRQMQDSAGAPWEPAIAPSDPRARAAFARGYAQGRAERNVMNVCRCEHCQRDLGIPAQGLAELDAMRPMENP